MTHSISPFAYRAATGSFLLLTGAYIFEYLGYTPCQMCYWQRWPHMVAIAIGILATFVEHRVLLLLGAAAAATTAGLGAYHSAVEQGWLDGPSSCTMTNNDLSSSAGDLLSTSGLDLVILCDQISWAFLSLSMPTWNAILSACLTFIWLRGFVKTAAPPFQNP